MHYPVPSEDVLSSLATIAREWTNVRTLDDTLAAVTSAAAGLIAGADAADILVMTGKKKFRSHAPTNALPTRLDELQEGPCIDAAADALVVHSDDVGADRRWPRFGPRATEEGVRSVLSIKLFTGGSDLGALNLFGEEPRAFTEADIELAMVLGTHAAIALQSVTDHEHFASALASRDAIGQAKGVLMERYNIGATHAFGMLSKLSQDQNIPVAELARMVVRRE